MASNYAAWLTAEKARPFEIKPVPLGAPGKNQILIKNHAVAVNPIDGKLQESAFYPLDYPTILGQDVAGEVVEVGPNVTRFKNGDRVIGVTTGFTTKSHEEKGFQLYTVLQVNLASEIPNEIPYERGVVLPLAIATACAGLFQTDFLNLQLPTEPAQKSTGKTLLVWGGASSVGCAAIQLGIAAGYEVFTTASPKNFELVKKLGASQVFDYHSATVTSDILDAFKDKSFAGVYDAVGGAAWAPCLEITHKLDGPKFVPTTIPGFSTPPEGVSIRQVHAPDIINSPVAQAVWEGFVPKALESGSFITAPEPLVVGTGLESVQAAVDVRVKGVSAQKVVVSL